MWKCDDSDYAWWANQLSRLGPKSQWQWRGFPTTQRNAIRLQFFFGDKHRFHVHPLVDGLLGVAALASQSRLGRNDGDHAILSKVVSCLVVWSHT